MKIEIIKNIIDLRAAVSFLGEKKEWWNSQFHDPSSKDFLSYIFPKSKNTQFYCANISTQYFIDNQVGANYYHLFRFPLSIEELINKKEKESGIDATQTEDKAFELLTEIAANLNINSMSGPKNIGAVDQLDSGLIQVFAAEYLNAFMNDYQVHPYLN